MYSERLLEHFRSPRNAGKLDAPAVTVNVSNPACGDVMFLYARLEDGRLSEVRYQVKGCTASIAAGSALTEWLAGKSIAEIAALQPAVIEEALGSLPPASKHAALLSVDAVRALLRSLESK